MKTIILLSLLTISLNSYAGYNDVADSQKQAEGSYIQILSDSGEYVNLEIPETHNVNQFSNFNVDQKSGLATEFDITGE